MSMLVNRERARARGVERPADRRPALGAPRLREGRALLRHGARADPARRRVAAPTSTRDGATRSATNTAVVVASAFSYPYGVMDPVEELAALAKSTRRRLSRRRLHRQLRAARSSSGSGTTCRRGTSASTASPRSRPTCTSTATARRVRRSCCTTIPTGSCTRSSSTTSWPSGLYGSPAIAGARPAAPIATAWAVLNHLGMDGYVEIHAS